MTGLVVAQLISAIAAGRNQFKRSHAWPGATTSTPQHKFAPSVYQRARIVEERMRSFEITDKTEMANQVSVPGLIK